jgi:hypothetical protein
VKSLLLSLFLLLSISTLSAQDKTYSGVYIKGHEVRTFQPCGGEVQWVDATQWVIGPLDEFYKSETTKASQPVYVTVRGHKHNEVLNGLEKNYSGIFHISEVYLFSSVVPDTCKHEEHNTTVKAK